jgi:hypothetical protein
MQLRPEPEGGYTATGLAFLEIVTHGLIRKMSVPTGVGRQPSSLKYKLIRSR